MTGSHTYDPGQYIDAEADAWVAELRTGQISEDVLTQARQHRRWYRRLLEHRGVFRVAKDKGALDIAEARRETWKLLRLVLLPARWRRVHLPGGTTCDGHGRVISRSGGAS